MNKAENPISHEENGPSFIIRNEEGKFHITSPHVDIARNREPLKFIVTVRKLPTSVEFGQTIQGITIDNESLKLQQMRSEAAALQILPERERITPLINLVRKNIQYAFSWTMDELMRTDPGKAMWVEEHIRQTYATTLPLTTSNIVDAGYGICRHFSVTTFSLAKDAGFQGAHFVHAGSKEENQSKLRNIIRKDTGKPVFQSIGVNELYDGGHGWFELLMSDGEWIPVDPTTQLTGLTPQGMQTFKDANYRGLIEPSIEEDGLPKFTYGMTNPSSLHFVPGEKTASGFYSVSGKQYQGPLDFTLSPGKEPNTGTNIQIISVLPARPSKKLIKR